MSVEERSLPTKITHPRLDYTFNKVRSLTHYNNKLVLKNIYKTQIYFLLLCSITYEPLTPDSSGVETSSQHKHM